MQKNDHQPIFMAVSDQMFNLSSLLTALDEGGIVPFNLDALQDAIYEIEYQEYEVEQFVRKITEWIRKHRFNHRFPKTCSGWMNLITSQFTTTHLCVSGSRIQKYINDMRTGNMPEKFVQFLRGLAAINTETNIEEGYIKIKGDPELIFNVLVQRGIIERYGQRKCRYSHFYPISNRKRGASTNESDDEDEEPVSKRRKTERSCVPVVIHSGLMYAA